MWDNVIAVVMGGIYELARPTQVLQDQMVFSFCISLISDVIIKYLGRKQLREGKALLGLQFKAVAHYCGKSGRDLKHQIHHQGQTENECREPCLFTLSQFSFFM